HIEVFLGGTQLASFERIRGNTPQVRIDYHHILDSLVRKPGAFARYKWRAELFPTLTFRRAYDAMISQANTRADPEYVRILALAARTMESSVEAALELLLESDERLELMSVEALVVGVRPEVPDVAEVAPDLVKYDELLGGLR
ncbi:MAG: IS21 family transposase, partial [Myxococcota bacterium]